MKLLLDTHALLWWLADAPLADPAREAIASPESTVLASAASVWEISIKRALGKLRTGEDLSGAIGAAGFDPLPIGVDHAEAAGALPSHHRDPFDRMLVAQAMITGSTLVTRDRAYEPYGVPVLHC